MKTFLISLLSLTSLVALGQNNFSNGNVLNSNLTSLDQPSLSSSESFRFRKGNITQLDRVTSDFSFSSSNAFNESQQWFSMGRVETPSLELYGLRFQRAGRALTMGFSGDRVNGSTPTLGQTFIEWIGSPSNSSGDLIFNVTQNPFDPNSRKLVMKMREDGTGLYGSESSYENNEVFFAANPLYNYSLSGPSSAKYEINNTSNYDGLGVISKGTPYRRNDPRYVNPNRAGYFKSIGGDFHVGIEILSSTNKLSANTTAFGIITNANASNAYGIYSKASGTNEEFSGYFNGDIVVTGAIFNTSDENLKENIERKENEIERINQLRPSEYTFIQTKEEINLPDNLQHGFLAQELKEVYPSLVREISQPDSKDKIQVVNYNGLIAILTQGMQDLSQKVESLESELEQYKKTYVVLTDKKEKKDLSTIINETYYLAQNVPNPFSDRTVIEYEIPADEKNAYIYISDLNGRIIKEYKLNPKNLSIEVMSNEVGRGMYLYSLYVNKTEIITKKMLVK